MNPVIILYDSIGLGLIISRPSGVFYSNQVGGHACMQPAIEGVYVPLHDEVKNQEQQLHDYFTGPKWNGWGCYPLDETDADFIDGVLSQSMATSFLKVDRTRLDESVEAWVYVKVSNQPPERPTTFDGKIATTASGATWRVTDFQLLPIPPEHFPIFGFGECTGILTWCNSD